MTLEVKDRHVYETTWVPVIVLTFHKRRESTNLQNEAPKSRVTSSDARHFECGTLSGEVVGVCRGLGLFTLATRPHKKER